MRRYLTVVILIFCFAGAALSQGAGTGSDNAAVAKTNGAAELPKLEKFDRSLLDASKDPCTDFYQYTCSKWVAAHPISSDMPVSSTELPLFLYNQTILRNALEAAAANKQATGSERQIGDYWQSCMDESGRNAKGKTWLQPHLGQIASLKSKKDLPRVLAYLHRNFPASWAMWNEDDNGTKAPIFGFGPAQDLKDASLMVAGVDQGGMALPSIDYYLDGSPQMKSLRDKYIQHVQKLLVLAGEPSDRATADAKTVLEIETAFAKASMDNVTRRNPEKIYNKRSLQELKTAVPDFGWDEYLKLMGTPSVPFYIVSTPGFLTAVEQQIKTRSVEDWRAYLRWWMVHRAAPYLGNDFEGTNFEYFGTALSGTPQMLPRWRRCVGSADRYLGEALGQAYVNIAFPAESKQRANELVGRIRQALVSEINDLDWMSDQTKKQALIKQEATLQKIGYPDKWRDYSSVKVVADNYLSNVNAATGFEEHRQISKIGKPVDRTEWTMTPSTINAYEDPQMNTINFPAGILQLPFFGGDQDDASNYGAIGMVIGHEAIHGFDDQGRKFDARGNLRDWWTPEDSKRYDEKDKCIVDQYTQDIPEYGVKQNGKLTAGEDTADNGGLHLAMLALEDKYKSMGKSLDSAEADGLTPRQRFFLANAFSWCSDVRPEAARNQVITNPHSLDRFRVNWPMSNSPEFQQAFGCKQGQPMVHATQCRVW
ncbi:MAG TPA: M13 family metallopeptidase [Terriglobales bacterium]|nr:M13 family metallopeptidase [Terriglobales bacterium]